MSKHDEMDPKEEAKLIEEFKQIVQKFEGAKANKTMPQEGAFHGLKGNKLKGWQEQIQQMKARIDRFTREHGKKWRHQHM